MTKMLLLPQNLIVNSYDLESMDCYGWIVTVVLENLGIEEDKILLIRNSIKSISGRGSRISKTGAYLKDYCNEVILVHGDSEVTTWASTAENGTKPNDYYQGLLLLQEKGGSLIEKEITKSLIIDFLSNGYYGILCIPHHSGSGAHAILIKQNNDQYRLYDKNNKANPSVFDLESIIQPIKDAGGDFALFFK